MHEPIAADQHGILDIQTEIDITMTGLIDIVVEGCERAMEMRSEWRDESNTQLRHYVDGRPPWMLPRSS